jgi:hypothetical protein
MIDRTELRDCALTFIAVMGLIGFVMWSNLEGFNVWRAQERAMPTAHLSGNFQEQSK